MFQRKNGSHVSTANANGAANNRNGVEVSWRKSNEKDAHWNFLDDIEAPMWVDLTQECQSTCQDSWDDEWFNISHPFHRCSSQQLISAFPCDGEGHTNLDLFVQAQFSPKLPCSISRSRGKDYRSKEWGQTNGRVTFDLQHSAENLKNKPSSVSSVTIKVSANQASYARPVELAGSRSDSTGESSLTEIDAQHDQSLLPSGDQKFLSNSTFFEGGENNLTSTITSEGSDHQQQKSLEISSKVSVQTSRFLSELKISLRKSYVTRQASRMQVTDWRQSEGQNSSSSKSSVGSSLSLGCDGKNLTVGEKKDKTPGSRYVTRVAIASNDKVNAAKPSITSNPKLRTQSVALPSFKQNAKGKVQLQTVHAKVLAPQCVNERFSSAASIKVKEKAVVISRGQIPAGGKENLLRKAGESHKSNTREKVTGDIEQVKKVMRRKLPENSGKTKLVNQKERISGRGEGKSGTVARKAYFR